MKITESRLRHIVREVIAESEDSRFNYWNRGNNYSASTSSYMTDYERKAAEARNSSQSSWKPKQLRMRRDDLGEGYYQEMVDGIWKVYDHNGIQVHFEIDPDDVEEPLDLRGFFKDL
jgi:hypothetical protein